MQRLRMIATKTYAGHIIMYKDMDFFFFKSVLIILFILFDQVGGFVRKCFCLYHCNFSQIPKRNSIMFLNCFWNAILFLSRHLSLFSLCFAENRSSCFLSLCRRDRITTYDWDNCPNEKFFTSVRWSYGERMAVNKSGSSFSPELYVPVPGFWTL